MAISDEILMDLKGLTIAFEVWEKLKATYEITTLINQVHLMRKLVCMQLNESKSVVEHLSPLHVLSHNCKTLDYLALMISLRPSFC